MQLLVSVFFNIFHILHVKQYIRKYRKPNATNVRKKKEDKAN